MDESSLTELSAHFDQLAAEVRERSTRAEVNARFDKLDTEVHEKATKTEMNARFDKLEAEVREKAGQTDMNARFAAQDVRFDELRWHFDLTAESFRSDFRNLVDLVQVNAVKTDVRFEEMMRENRRGWDEIKALFSPLRNDHVSLETRVSRLEDRLQ